MKQFTSFFKKEITELVRTGKLALLLILFFLFGIMNPAIAKLIPWMMEAFAGSLAETGLAVTAVEVDALTSWTQFYKNIPMALIVFLLLFSGIFTSEYQKGTLVNVLTKGLPRWKVVTAKTVCMVGLWTVGYWLCYGVTYGYNAFFWDNSIADHLFFAAFCYYFAGIWLIAVMTIVATCLRTSSAVLLATGGVFAVMYLFSLIPMVEAYLPAKLMTSSALLNGAAVPSEYLCALLVTAVLVVLCFLLAVLCFNRKAF